MNYDFVRQFRELKQLIKCSAFRGLQQKASLFTKVHIHAPHQSSNFIFLTINRKSIFHSS